MFELNIIKHNSGGKMDENKESKETDKTEHKSECWIKFALMLFALFIACYLAVYYILDQMRYAYYIPSAPIENIDRIISEQDKMFNKEMREMGAMMPNMGALPMHNSAMMTIKSPIETYKDTENNEYKMIIDLKPFNNNPKNVDIKINKNKVSITAAGEKSGKHSDKVYSFSQSFVLPEEIETDKVTKEVKHHKYIITMPIDD